jgi:hypothetical protein
MEIKWGEARSMVEAWQVAETTLELQGIFPALEVFGLVRAFVSDGIMEFTPVHGGLTFRLRADDRKLGFWRDEMGKLVVDASGDLAMRLTLTPHA